MFSIFFSYIYMCYLCMKYVHQRLFTRRLRFSARFLGWMERTILTHLHSLILFFFSLKYLSYNTCYEQHRTWLECALCILHSTAYFEVISWLNIVHRIECKPNAWTLLALIECKLVEIELQNVQISISNLVYRTCLKKWLL